MTIPVRFATTAAADLFDQRFDEQAQVGDRLALGRAILVVRSLRDDRVAQVGLRFAGVGERLLGGTATTRR
jgi:cell volume regulation protein A